MNFWAKAEELNRQGTPFVVVTLVSGRGSVPQEPGAKAIVTAEGLFHGTVGGGKVEARAVKHAREKLVSPSPAPELVTWNLQRDILMTCGGEVTYLFETHSSKHWRLAVFGAGHVSQAVVRLLLTLDCQITCIDPRAEWLDRLPESPSLQKICAPEPAQLVSRLSGHFFAVMTQGHATDLPILEEIFRLHPSAPYVGSIGSDLKAMKVRNDLCARGIADHEIEKLRCPIGLRFGSNQPAEIAVSVVAELLQARDQWKKT